MVRSSELEVHARAKELFERENPGRLWRAPVGSVQGSADDLSTANLMERQNYLSYIRAQMRAEGMHLEAEEKNPSQ